MISFPFLSIRSGVKISQEDCGNLEIEGDADGVDDGGNEGPAVKAGSSPNCLSRSGMSAPAKLAVSSVASRAVATIQPRIML